MDILVLNRELEAIAVIDTYESLIWTDRYRDVGDFELYIAEIENLLSVIRQDYYLVNRASDRAMIIEKFLIASDVENGNRLTISGRSLESILDRRIIWLQTIVTGNLQTGIKKLLDENLINPGNADRKIPNFIFKESEDPLITALTIDAQYTGDNLLDVVRNICGEHDIGFKVTLNDSNQFVFELYAGADRSYDQTTNPYVVFSPKFENIINSNYIESKSALKNVTLIGGEGEGYSRRYDVVGEASGMDRRELFTDARDISSDAGDGVTLTDFEYHEHLKQRGKEKLAECEDIISFEGQVDTTNMYHYGEDFFMGDIVQFANEYGHEARVRVLEFVMSEDASGSSTYPTFATILPKGE